MQYDSFVSKKTHHNEMLQCASSKKTNWNIIINSLVKRKKNQKLIIQVSKEHTKQK